jgi:hypothetical protein
MSKMLSCDPSDTGYYLIYELDSQVGFPKGIPHDDKTSQGVVS